MEALIELNSVNRTSRTASTAGFPLEESHSDTVLLVGFQSDES
jgi:hypothetical protein